MQRAFLAGLVIALALTVAWVALYKRQSSRPSASQITSSQSPKALPPVAAIPAPTELAPAEEIPAAHDHTASIPAARADAPVKTAKPAAATASNAAPGKKPKLILDPEARVALSFVGSDPEAEEYWFEAINDPDLPANERQDLIEDLNEDGLSNPDHPGMQDLPLIVNRLSILQQLASDPMDQVNAAAIQEAYKDLMEMYGNLTRN